MNDPATLASIAHASADRVQEIRTFSGGPRMWDDHDDFADLVEKKRIAVVGPARTLTGTNKGEWIDSHDLVVRFNDAFVHTTESGASPADLGFRTDILYCNQVILRKEILERMSTRNRFAAFARGSDLKYVVCTNNSLSYRPDGLPSPHCERKDRDIPKRFVRYLAEKVPGTGFRTVHSASELLIKWLNGHWGRTGFVAIMDLLGHRLAHLSIVGMTLYHGGGHIASQGPELHPRGNRDGTSSISPSGFGHDSSLELIVLRDLITAFGSRISVDGPLQALLTSIKANP